MLPCPLENLSNAHDACQMSKLKTFECSNGGSNGVT
jgi:hypothetical protein